MAGSGGRSWKKILLWVIGIGVVVFLLIQLVPYGRSSHTNPPATSPFQWADPQAEAIAKSSCYDCHSNETEWWWATEDESTSTSRSTKGFPPPRRSSAW
jgi:hypothetical protein